MYAVIGTLLFAVAVTLFTWSALQYRQPVPARWTIIPSAAMVLALASTVALLLSASFYGLAYLGAADTNAMSAPVIAALAAVIGVGVFAMRRMIVQWRDLGRGRTVFVAGRSGPANDANPGGRNPVAGAPSSPKPRRQEAA
ncbi:MAG: hypothetical protein WD767_11055 [Alphaproteobacteria bacterium]